MQQHRHVRQVIAAVAALGLTATACGATSSHGSAASVRIAGQGSHSTARLSRPASGSPTRGSSVASAQVPAAASQVGTVGAAVPQVAGATAVAASSALEFDSPSGLAVAHNALWVSNLNGNSVTEINPSTGDWLRTVRGASYGFNRPSAIIAYGSYLFVANEGGSVTEVNAANGLAVRIIAGSQYHFSNPIALAVAGAIIVVVNESGWLTEFSAASGGFIRTVSGAKFGFNNPIAIAVSASGAYVFVADRGDNTVTEVNATNGSLTRIIRGAGLDSPGGIAISGSSVWVSDSASNAATKIDASTGAILGTFGDADGPYGFGNPTAVYANGANIFVTTPLGVSPMVTKVSSSANTPYWFMCNTNGPYYFSLLSALAATGSDLWVASRSGANNPKAGARYGSLTEMSTITGALIRTLPAH